MADPQSSNLKDLEGYKFGRDSEDNVAVKVIALDGDLVLGVHYDDIIVTFPNATTERVTYNLSAVAVRIVDVFYSNASKSQFTGLSVIL